MVCYTLKQNKLLQQDQKPLSQTRKNASVRVDELSKEVNTYLNISSDQYIQYKYRLFQKKVKMENTHHVFKRLEQDA